jgi:hypothetical protein
MLLGALRELTAPNIRLFTAYRSENLRPDLVAGLSVAAVQIPTAIAYAQLAGFPPTVDLYAAILPSVGYAFFGSSRKLMMGAGCRDLRDAGMRLQKRHFEDPIGSKRPQVTGSILPKRVVAFPTVFASERLTSQAE